MVYNPTPIIWKARIKSLFWFQAITLLPFLCVVYVFIYISGQKKEKSLTILMAIDFSLLEFYFCYFCIVGKFSLFIYRKIFLYCVGDIPILVIV